MGKILITGAAGFVGSHLVDHLLKNENKDRLRLFVEKNKSLDNLSRRDLDIIKGDVRNLDMVNQAMNDVEVVYHLAAEIIKPEKTYRDYEQVNVNGTQNLLNACKNKNIQKFVYFSSIAVFGLPAYVGDIINWDENKPKMPSESYGKSKLEAEKRILSFHDKYRTPYSIVRPTTVYGPKDHQSLIDLYRAIKGKYFFMIGEGNNKLDYVFVKDLVKGARLAQTSNFPESDYILGSGKPTAFKYIVKSVAKSLNTTVPKYHVPKGLGLLFGYGAEMINKTFNTAMPFSLNRVRVITSNCYYSINKARREIGYDPATKFEDGTKITGEWFLKNQGR